jgi:type VI secretion system secreted protein VgrG
MASLASTFTLEGEKLPADATAVRFEAFEAISEPYSVLVELSTHDAGYLVEDCLRTRLCLIVVGGSGQSRYFDGIVDQARLLRVIGDERFFEVRLRPAMAALAHRAGCRIHQEKTIVQVVGIVLDEAGLTEQVEWRTVKEYEPRELIVQYRESHLSFVSRLLEDSGLFYFFEHTAEGHKMIIADDVSAFGTEEGAAPVAFGMAQGGGATESPFGGDPLSTFSRSRGLAVNHVHLADYDFEKPGFQPEATLPREEAWQMRYFEYPGGFTKSAPGANRADARMRALRAEADICEGESSAVGLRVGAPFSVQGAAEPSLNGEFVLTSLSSRGSQTVGTGASNSATRNQFRGIPKGAPFAARQRAERPRIRGVQTAVVTGSSDQEQAIHVDKYGRIKVRFHWDRLGQQDHTSSCWLRVSQLMMGGSMILPRVGWEVSVAFLDGDPDRPIVLGRVYNAEKVPPYALPATKASGSIKSMSSPGAGGHNELLMADSGGSQGFSIHAQKDLNVTIGHDKIEEVGVDEEQNVACNGSSTVGVDESITVSGNQALDVGSVLSHHITGNQTISVGGNDTSNAISNFVEKIGGDRAYSVGGNQITISNGTRQSVTGSISRTVGTLQLTASIASINDNVIGALSENVGAIKAQLVNGSHAEQIAGNKDQTSAAAELHMTKAAMAFTAGGSVTTLVGGLHYQKLVGDYVVKAPTITLVGAVGVFKAGGSQLKLGGGPVVIKGSKIAVDAALIVKMSTSMKLGS